MFKPTIKNLVENVGFLEPNVWEVPVFDEKMKDAVLKKGTVWLVDNMYSTYKVRSATVLDVSVDPSTDFDKGSMEYMATVKPKFGRKEELIFGEEYGSGWFLSGREAAIYSAKMMRKDLEDDLEEIRGKCDEVSKGVVAISARISELENMTDEEFDKLAA